MVIDESFVKCVLWHVIKICNLLLLKPVTHHSTASDFTEQYRRSICSSPGPICPSHCLITDATF